MTGDLFDEGLWSNELDFNSYVGTFKYFFSVPQGIQLYAIVGNHDIGFHYRYNLFIICIYKIKTYFIILYSIMPQLEKRFNRAFNTSPVELISKRNVHFVAINSMAMEMDGCFLCYTAEISLRKISSKFVKHNM